MYAIIRVEISSKDPEKVPGVPGGPGGPGGPGDPTTLFLPAQNTWNMFGVFSWPDSVVWNQNILIYSEMYWCISVEEAKAPGRPGGPGGPGGPGAPEVTEEENSKTIKAMQWRSACKGSYLKFLYLEKKQRFQELQGPLRKWKKPNIFLCTFVIRFCIMKHWPLRSQIHVR